MFTAWEAVSTHIYSVAIRYTGIYYVLLYVVGLWLFI